MEFLIDTANIAEIREAMKHLPISGVTSNPTIVKAAAPKDFFAHMREIRSIIGKERSLHIQVVSDTSERMIEEAHRLRQEIDDEVYIKIPVTYEGILAIKALKAEGCNVTATAVYDLMQGYLALATKADCIAPYVNRIGNLGGDPFTLIRELSEQIAQEHASCRIVAASFKGVQQIREAFHSKAAAITAAPALLKQVFANESIEKAVKDFQKDWYAVYGEGKDLCDL